MHTDRCFIDCNRKHPADSIFEKKPIDRNRGIINMILKTENLSKVYKVGDTTITAVDNINMEIKSGSYVSIMGASGSGKSTLLHLLGGLDKPTSGKVFLGDNDISQLNDRLLSKIRCNEIGFVFQKFYLINEMTIRENIIAPVLIAGNKPDEDYIDEICYVLGIEDRLSHMPLQLSGGQQQRVAIARALANNPEIILCDEPTGNLDKQNSKEVVKLLSAINDKYNKTIVVVTHDPYVGESASVLYHMEDGRLGATVGGK